MINEVVLSLSVEENFLELLFDSEFKFGRKKKKKKKIIIDNCTKASKKCFFFPPQHCRIYVAE